MYRKPNNRREAASAHSPDSHLYIVARKHTGFGCLETVASVPAVLTLVGDAVAGTFYQFQFILLLRLIVVNSLVPDTE